VNDLTCIIVKQRWRMTGTSIPPGPGEDLVARRTSHPRHLLRLLSYTNPIRVTSLQTSLRKECCSSWPRIIFIIIPVIFIACWSPGLKTTS
jgi:hypothetical protein